MNVVVDSTGVLRGPQPESFDDMLYLACRDVTRIINLKSDFWEEDEIQAERGWAVQCGIEYITLPMSPITPPRRGQIQAAVDAIFNPRGSTYVHCKDGVDRTGCVLWAYDAWIRGMCLDEAEELMMRRGFHKWRYWFWLPSMRRLIGRH